MWDKRLKNFFFLLTTTIFCKQFAKLKSSNTPLPKSNKFRKNRLHHLSKLREKSFSSESWLPQKLCQFTKQIKDFCGRRNKKNFATSFSLLCLKWISRKPKSCMPRTCLAYTYKKFCTSNSKGKVSFS